MSTGQHITFPQPPDHTNFTGHHHILWTHRYDSSCHDIRGTGLVIEAFTAILGWLRMWQW